MVGPGPRRSNLAEFGLWAKGAPIWDNFDPTRPMWQGGRKSFWPMSTDLRLMSGNFGPGSAKFGPTLTQFSQHGLIIYQVWSEMWERLAQCPPKLARHRPYSATIGPEVVA